MAAFLKLRRDRWWVTGREIRKVTMSFEAWSVKYRVRVPWNIHQRVASRDPLSSVRSIRAGKPLEFPPSPVRAGPSYVIRLLKYQSQHFTLCTASRAGVSPILTLFSVWTRSSKMQQQSAELVERTSKQRTNRLPAWTPGMHAGFSLSL